MADGPEDTRRVEVEGVTVEKTFVPGEFSHPAVRLDLVSAREEPVAVRITEEPPAGFDTEDLAFHHAFEDEPWTGYADGAVVVEPTLEPEGSKTVVYGLRTDEPDAARELLSVPSVEVTLAE